MSGYTSIDPCKGTRLSLATAVQCYAGNINGTTAGRAYDTLLYGVYIQANATACTLSIAGMADQAGAAQTLLMTGQTTQDFFWLPPAPILNSFGPFVFTASIANLAWVFTRAYIGPEAPLGAAFVSIHP